MKLGNQFRILVAWILAFLLSTAVMSFVVDSPKVLRLLQGHKDTEGQVLALIPKSHGLAVIEYSVDGETFKGDFEPHIRTRPLAAGDHVIVYYLPTDPKIAISAPPDDVLAEQLPGVCVVSVLLSSGVVGITLLRRSHRT